MCIRDRFRWILHPAGGLLNQLLERMGVEESISFLNDPRYALGCIIIITGWKMTGFFTLLFYSAVQNIDDGYYQAAAMDGAGSVSYTHLDVYKRQVQYMGMRSPTWLDIRMDPMPASAL